MFQAGTEQDIGSDHSLDLKKLLDIKADVLKRVGVKGISITCPEDDYSCQMTKSTDSNCTTTLKLDHENGKHSVVVCFGGLAVTLSLQTVITFALLQLPAVCLALYGVICAFRQPKNQPKKTIVHKIIDSLLALTVIIFPYCFTEIFTLVQFEFTDKGVDYLVTGVKSLCQKVYVKVVDLFPNTAAKTTFDLLKFLPNKDRNGRERSA